MRPFPVRLYAAAANLIAPLVYGRVKAKLAVHDTDPARYPEKLGHATAKRPDGTLVWFHAASVGESLSVLGLITHIGRAHPGWSFLITSGTASSAQIVARRLPPRTRHQFAPLDSRRAVRRFLDHWRPAAAIFVESELWPQMLGETRARDIPLALINARISDGSARNWKRAPKTARHLLGHFALIHTQDARTTKHLHDLGQMNALTGQNLKAASGPLPYSAEEHGRLITALNGRPLWLASSTHPGEDEIALDAHAALLADHPRLCLILVPRHPERADGIEAQIAARALTFSRRGTGGRIGPGTQIYLADTLGETGLWYALSPLTCLCGSFAPVGGHNPYEPAYAGSAVLHGPRHANFAKVYADFDASGGALEVADAPALAGAAHRLLSDHAALADMRAKARGFAGAQQDMLDGISTRLIRALGLA